MYEVEIDGSIKTAHANQLVKIMGKPNIDEAQKTAIPCVEQNKRPERVKKQPDRYGW